MDISERSLVSLQLGYYPKGYRPEKPISIGFSSIDLDYDMVDTVMPLLSPEAMVLYLALRYLQNTQDALPTPELSTIKSRFCPEMSQEKFDLALVELLAFKVNGRNLVVIEKVDRELLDRLEGVEIERVARNYEL